ncbi:type I restriction endonuclease subunit R [Thalassotalea sp. ND16A]|uniref:type I restriction endonuclease subunit R n=1 Tax=Thalassotalea sp. ND16A TaxID=1535422 RepID=UPI00051A7796|nr:DEAD/DEAH box helicase family protein [Thalassotalea sp. ND16A]KGK00166.1 hypothetical protein ND16A_3637 [Thalassotalea sp. ND16A]
MNNKNNRQPHIAHIDNQLEAAGWQLVLSTEDAHLYEGDFAIRKDSLKSPGYILLVNGEAVGAINTVEQPCFSDDLPFNYVVISEKILFTNKYDPRTEPREVFHFHQPETLKAFLKSKSSLLKKLQELPGLNPDNLPPSELGLRDCQEAAIRKLESSLRQNQERTLIQMATGSGKTYTAINSMYRLLKYAKAKRILFIVDTKNLGEQAEQEMLNFKPVDSTKMLHRLHPIHRFKSSYVPTDAQIYICTIQRLYSILSGKAINEETDDYSDRESISALIKSPTIAYNPSLPIEFFDLIFIDECHRSIYNLWRQIFDYFDSMLIGLTATPDNRTFGFFGRNLVFQYSHEEAVADGVNVGYEVYLIETEVTQQGGKLKAMEPVQYRERLTNKTRWDQQDQDEIYSAKHLDDKIINPSQIKTIIETFKASLPDIFPARTCVPKTLIFAKSDSHADDIVRIVRETFNEDDNFCKKITYKVQEGLRNKKGELIEKGEQPGAVLSRFRNNHSPRIAVTVDMIATGTDIKPLECLLFMRDVKSRNYFEQMKGRGVRTLDKQRMQRVTDDAISDKTHFVIVDAVGITQSLATPSQPLISNPSVPLKKLANAVMMGAYGLDTVKSLAGRLARLDRQLEEQDKKRIEMDSGGITLTQIVRGLIDAINIDDIEIRALQIAGLPQGDDPGEQYRKSAQQELVSNASKVFNERLIKTIVNIRSDKDLKIDYYTSDKLTYAGWSEKHQLNAQTLRDEFSQYLKNNIDSITALEIYFKEPYRRREVTFDMVSELMDTLKADRPQLAPVRIWDAYAEIDQNKSKRPEAELQLIIALIRRVSGVDNTLSPFVDTVRRNFQRWILSHHSGSGEKFSKEQMGWLRMIRDHIASSFHFELDDLEKAPFDAQGSTGKMHQLFDEEMHGLIETLNKELAA